MWQFKHATIWTWKVWATLWDRLTITSTPKSYVNTRSKHILTWAVPTPHCESPFEYYKATNNKLSNRIAGIPRSLSKVHPRCSSGLEPHFHISYIYNALKNGAIYGWFRMSVHTWPPSHWWRWGREPAHDCSLRGPSRRCCQSPWCSLGTELAHPTQKTCELSGMIFPYPPIFVGGGYPWSGDENRQPSQRSLDQTNQNLCVCF